MYSAFFMRHGLLSHGHAISLKIRVHGIQNPKTPNSSLLPVNLAEFWVFCVPVYCDRDTARHKMADQHRVKSCDYNRAHKDVSNARSHVVAGQIKLHSRTRVHEPGYIGKTI